MFTKALIFCQLDTKNSSFRWSFDSFSSSFVESRSSLDTRFGAIIDKRKLMELLIFCHVIPKWEEVELKYSNSSPAVTTVSLHQSFYPRSARLPSTTSALRYIPGILASRRLKNTLRTSFFHFFNFGDPLRKKTSKPSIRAEILNGWEDVKGIIKTCFTLLRSSKLRWLAILISRKLDNLLLGKTLSLRQSVPILVDQSRFDPF